MSRKQTQNRNGQRSDTSGRRSIARRHSTRCAAPRDREARRERDSLEGQEMARFKSTSQIEKKQTRRPWKQGRMFGSSARPAASGGQRARGRRGESLASSRDRQRLRERNMAERERVEGMIASVPVPVERRSHRRESLVREYDRHTPSTELRTAEPVGCPVCGDSRIVTDEVMHGGTLRMSECLHCDHRWTRRPKGHWIELGARMSRSARRGATRTAEHSLAS